MTRLAARVGMDPSSRPSAHAVTLSVLGAAGVGGTRRAFSVAFQHWPRWLAPDYRHRHGSLDLLSGVELPAALAGRVASDVQRLDLERVTLPRLLHFADRNSMRWSREVRLPYLDHRLVEFAMSVPIQSKLSGGWTKEPLRALLEAHSLTGVARNPRKVGFAPPTAEWMTAPKLVERLNDAWGDLNRRDYLARAVPEKDPLVQWRVLSLAVWAAAYGVDL